MNNAVMLITASHVLFWHIYIIDNRLLFVGRAKVMHFHIGSSYLS